MGVCVTRISLATAPGIFHEENHANPEHVRKRTLLRTQKDVDSSREEVHLIDIIPHEALTVQPLACSPIAC